MRVAIPDNGLAANFFGLGSGTVDLGATSRTVGALNFNNAGASYTIMSSAGGQLIMNNTGGNAKINVLAGTHADHRAAATRRQYRRHSRRATAARSPSAAG